MARVKRERDRFVGFVLEGVERIPEADRIRGYARFIDRNTLQVDGGPRITARSDRDRHRLAPDRPAAARQARRSARRQRRRVRLGRPAEVGRRVRPRRDRPRARPGARAPRRARRRARARRPRGPDHRSRRCAHAAIKAFSRGLLPRSRRAGGARRARGRRGRDRVRRLRRQAASPSASTTCSPPPAARPTSTGLGLENTGVELRRAAACRCSTATTLQAGATLDLHRGRRRRTTCRCCTRPRTKAASPARTPRASRPWPPGLRRAPLGVVFTDPQIAIVGGGMATLAKGRVRRGRGLLRGPGPLARDAAQPGPPARLRRLRRPAASSAPR